jgi:hypothetical protein
MLRLAESGASGAHSPLAAPGDRCRCRDEANRNYDPAFCSASCAERVSSPLKPGFRAVCKAFIGAKIDAPSFFKDSLLTYEASSYRPNLIGMRSIRCDNIFPGITGGYVEKRSGLAIVGRRLRPCFTSLQLRGAVIV